MSTKWTKKAQLVWIKGFQWSLNPTRELPIETSEQRYMSKQFSQCRYISINSSTFPLWIFFRLASSTTCSSCQKKRTQSIFPVGMNFKGTAWTARLQCWTVPIFDHKFHQTGCTDTRSYRNNLILLATTKWVLTKSWIALQSLHTIYIVSHLCLVKTIQLPSSSSGSRATGSLLSQSLGGERQRFGSSRGGSSGNWLPVAAASPHMLATSISAASSGFSPQTVKSSAPSLLHKHGFNSRWDRLTSMLASSPGQFNYFASRWPTNLTNQTSSPPVNLMVLFVCTSETLRIN